MKTILLITWKLVPHTTTMYSFCLFFWQIILVNFHSDSLQIQVYLPNKLVVTGTLQHYNLEYNVAVISVMGFRCLRTAEFNNQVQIEHQREVVAVGRVFESGKLMATSGIVTGEESKLDCKELMVTTCKITEVHAFFLLFLPSFEHSSSFCTKIF